MDERKECKKEKEEKITRINKRKKKQGITRQNR